MLARHIDQGAMLPILFECREVEKLMIVHWKQYGIDIGASIVSSASEEAVRRRMHSAYTRLAFTSLHCPRPSTTMWP